MKIGKYVTLGASLLLLAACGAKDSSQETQVSKTGQTQQVKSQSKSQQSSGTSASSETVSQEATQESGQVVPEVKLDKGVAYNGSYYYVIGKGGQEIPVVNKHYPLSANYNPCEDPTAKSAFLELLAGMREAGFAVSDSYSGFRSYDTQAGLYQNYVARDGQAAADRYSARPGYSEHQSGLAFDIIDSSGNLLQEPAASQWLLKHAGDYGFVVRYLAGKEDVTGYQHEEWHVRYVGADAKAISQSGQTLEEYYGFTGGDYVE